MEATNTGADTCGQCGQPAQDGEHRQVAWSKEPEAPLETQIHYMLLCPDCYARHDAKAESKSP